MWFKDGMVRSAAKKNKEKNVLLLRCRLAAQVSERKVYSNRRFKLKRLNSNEMTISLKIMIIRWGIEIIDLQASIRHEKLSH